LAACLVALDRGRGRLDAGLLGARRDGRHFRGRWSLWRFGGLWRVLQWLTCAGGVLVSIADRDRVEAVSRLP